MDVGTGRFAQALGIKTGIDPSNQMRELTARRGIRALAGVGEDLPFPDHSFDLMLMSTTVCFLDDMDASFREAFRVLMPGEHILIGFIDADCPIGRLYMKHKDESFFYREARFYTATDIDKKLKLSGFTDLAFAQTVFRPLDEIDSVETVEDGYGKGSFVVIR